MPQDELVDDAQDFERFLFSVLAGSSHEAHSSTCSSMTVSMM